MAETKVITQVHVVLDTETGQEQIGDIEGGGFNEDWLRKHIAKHGTAQLLHTISYMAFQVIDAERWVNVANDLDAHCVASS